MYYILNVKLHYIILPTYSMVRMSRRVLMFQDWRIGAFAFWCFCTPGKLKNKTTAVWWLISRLFKAKRWPNEANITIIIIIVVFVVYRYVHTYLFTCNMFLYSNFYLPLPYAAGCARCLNGWRAALHHPTSFILSWTTPSCHISSRRVGNSH